MADLWVICGAGRNVGKSHLSKRLREILPDSIYAKEGCGKPREGKEPNFFPNGEGLDAFLEKERKQHSHLIVESNALARRGKGDCILFLEPLPCSTDIREDTPELRAAAHIRIGGEIEPVGWEERIDERIADPALGLKIRRLLNNQSRRYTRIGITVRSKLWFQKEESHVFGPGLAGLLESVQERGSLRAAVADANISYRHAWEMIREAEQHLGVPLIEPRVGGRGGGSSVLSENGRRFLSVFILVSTEVAAFADVRFAEEWEKSEKKK